MKTIQEIQEGISQSYGTTQYIKSNIWRGLVFTDGINLLRENADCYWLIDMIASYHRTEEFQIWNLIVDLKTHRAVLTMKEDSDKPVLVKKVIGYTDFPLSEIKFYVEKGGYGSCDNWTECMVLMLPSER